MSITNPAILTINQSNLTTSIHESSNFKPLQYQAVQEWINPADGWLYFIKMGQPIQIPGVLHYGEEQRIEQNFSQTVTNVTLESQIDFNLFQESFILSPYEGFPGGFFRRHKSFAPQAENTFHYDGYLLTPNLEQFILPSIPSSQAVIPTDSTPFWVSTNWGFPLYSSKQIYLNTTGLYGTVDIKQSEALTNPVVIPNTNPVIYNVLVRDDLELSLVNATNDQAFNFMQKLVETANTNCDIGFMLRQQWGFVNRRNVQDESSLRYNEKVLTLSVSYNAGTMAGLAQNYITKANVSFTFQTGG